MFLEKKDISRGKENQTSSMTGTQQANNKARAAHSHTHIYQHAHKT